MVAFTDFANQYRNAVEQKDSSKMHTYIYDATQYLSKAIDQTDNDSLSFDETQKNTILQFMSLKGITEKTEPELFDLVTLFNGLHNDTFNISLISHFFKEIHAYISFSRIAGEFGGITTNDDKYAICLIMSFHNTFKIPPDAIFSAIWIPDYSFLRNDKQWKDLAMPSTLGKNHDQRSPAFKPNAMLFMSKLFWHHDRDVHYFSREQKKLFKVRTTNQPFVLKRNFDEKRLPNGSLLYVLSMHGGLIAAQLSDLKDITNGNATLLKHSTFRAGQNLFCPGELSIDEFGMITEINGNSGHYLTPDENLIEAAFYLLDKGFIRETCRVKFRDSKLLEPISLKQLLENDSLNFSSDYVHRMVNERKQKQVPNYKHLKIQ